MESPRHHLARLAIAGDREALIGLLDAVEPDIRRFARMQCASSDADDAVQEALVQLVRRIGMLRAAAALPAWLFTTVRRACLRLARAALRREIMERHADERLWSGRTPAELRLDIARAIESLPANYRQIVVLRDFEEMTIDEIGAALALTREAVKGRLHRARALLREYLVEY